MRLTLTIALGLLFLACGNDPQPGAVAVTTSPEQTHDCDLQAAHPEDILRRAPGKEDGQIVGFLAQRACSEATKQFPNEARFHFQLGRALAALKRTDEAAKEFESAASMNYAPAKYYRADALLGSYWESGSETDYQKAVQILEEVQESFAPAAVLHKQVVFNSEGFVNPRIVEALYRRDIEQLNRARILVALYAQGMQEFLSTEWNPEENDCPAYLIDPEVNYHLDSAVAGDPRNTIERAAYDVGFIGVEWAGKLFIDPTWKGDPEKWRTYYKSLGRRDGQFLAREFGCQSPVTKNLYQGLVQFAKARKPLAEYLENLKNGEGKILFLKETEDGTEEPQEGETNAP